MRTRSRGLAVLQMFPRERAVFSSAGFGHIADTFSSIQRRSHFFAKGEPSNGVHGNFGSMISKFLRLANRSALNRLSCSDHTASTSSANPIPPLTHNVASPRRACRRAIS